MEGPLGRDPPSGVAVQRPGIVTGFLGPNGAGKSTTMRMIIGLDAPTAGSVTVNGKPYASHRAPLHEVGALLEARSMHTGRTAYNHLRALAQTSGIHRSRVEEVIEMVGLTEVARKRAGGFSLGMGQRLGIASALLGDPATVILDDLDASGIELLRPARKGEKPRPGQPCSSNPCARSSSRSTRPLRANSTSNGTAGRASPASAPASPNASWP